MKSPLPTGIPRFVYKIPFVVGSLLLVTVGVINILSFRTDTSTLTNSAFVIMLSIAAVTFSWARLIEDLSLRDRLTFVGERLLHGALLIITVSIVKYFVVLIIKVTKIAPDTIADKIITYAIGVPLGLVFMGGCIFAIRAIEIIYDLLLDRIDRHPDWD